MNLLTINNKLKDLYLSNWDKLHERFTQIENDSTFEVKPANPLLLKVNEKFETAGFKVMIFGQETNGWYEKGATLDNIISCYDDFYNSGYCYSYGGQFWNGFKRFVNSMQSKFPSKEIGYIWNNIIKIGCCNDKGLPPDYIYDIERNNFSVINHEIEIIKPDMILFLTGPYYDSKIEDVFDKLNYCGLEPFSSRQLSRMDLDKVSYSFRTYHPNFLWRNDIDKYFSRIIKEIII